MTNYYKYQFTKDSTPRYYKYEKGGIVEYCSNRHEWLLSGIGKPKKFIKNVTKHGRLHLITEEEFIAEQMLEELAK